MLNKFFDELEPQYKYPPGATLCLIAITTVLWTKLIFLPPHIDVDTAWLLQCLERFLAGGTYTQDFYETNPPLSFWIYLPAYPLYSWLDLDQKSAVFINIILYVGIADYTLLRLLQKEENAKTQDLLVIMAGVLIAQTWTSGLAFIFKDHIIATFLLPLLLYQYRLTRGLKTGTLLSIISIVIGGLAVCLKAHYAIIPATIFAHRLYTTRSLSRCIFAPDFLGLLLIGSGYLTAIYIFTPEFFDILPQIISLYRVETPFPLFQNYLYLIFGVFAGIAAPFVFLDKSQSFLKHSVYALSALSILCIIPYILQNKGFGYHALPTLYYGEIAFLIVIYGFSKQILHSKSDVALWITIAFTVYIFGSLSYNTKKLPLTNDQSMALPLISAIDELAWNRVYMTHYFKHLLAHLPSISSLQSGSRFAHMWAMHGLSIMDAKATTPEEHEKIKKQMYEVVDMMVEDMHRYKPSVILIPQYTNPETNQPSKMYYDFLIKHKAFKETLDNYKYHSTILFSTDENIQATEENLELIGSTTIVPHDIYVLKRENNL